MDVEIVGVTPGWRVSQLHQSLLNRVNLESLERKVSWVVRV